MSRILKLITPFALVFAVASGSAAAMGSGSDDGAKKAMDPNFLSAKQLMDDGKYAEAIPLLENVVATDKKNADAFNYLGYSNRQIGNHDAALTHYHAALALEPRHRGANEYLGELYLILGDLPKAEERLKTLDEACFFGCDEYTELKEAIAAYKAKSGS
ncbi:MAG: tetratricopeptide repeat protein [Kiloniellaceae bacterium]